MSYASSLIPLLAHFLTVSLVLLKSFQLLVSPQVLGIFPAVGMATRSLSAERRAMRREDPKNLRRDEKLMESLEENRMFWEDPRYEASRRRWDERTRMTFEDSERNQRLVFGPGSNLARELASDYD